MKDECLAFSHFITVDVSVCSHMLMFQLTPQTCYSIFHGSSVVSRWKWVHLNYCIPQTIFVPNQEATGVLLLQSRVKTPFQWPGPDPSFCQQSITLSSTLCLILTAPAPAYRVFLLFSPVIYCSPHPLAVQPSIFTTFLPGEQQQQQRSLALPAAWRQVPQVDLGRESGGSLSAASSSMDLLLPCAVAAVSAIDSCASVSLRGLCLQPVDMHGLADCTCSSILVEMQNEQL